MTTRSRRPFAALLLTLALLGAACSDSDDDAVDVADAPVEEDADREEAGGEGTGESSEASEASEDAAGDEPAFAAYDDHEPAQYAGTQHWICHPELADDHCDDLDTTVVRADGSREVEAFEPAADPSFDCFYVYPTTSSDTGVNSDLEVDASEIDTVRAQVARYTSVCSVYAPAYRQITLSGLGGGATPEARELAYGDVLDAWKTYVGQAGGRDVVLVGHSQGASLLRRLVEEEIEQEEGLRSRLVSAVLLGTSVPVPGEGGVAGGAEPLPACGPDVERGCLLSFSSYPAASPPAEGALFGRTRDDGQPALCVDPVALAGGDGLADPVLPTVLSLLGGVSGFGDVTTPFVSLPDAVRTSCATSGGYGYLAVEQAGPADPRPVAGLLEQRLGPTWGLHLLDANLVQDELIAVVAAQAEADAG